MKITLIAAQSLDGFIAKHDVPGSAFASPADQSHLRQSLAGFDCSVMGAETYRTSRDVIRERMKKPRLRIVLSRAPGVLKLDEIPGKLEFSSAPPADLVAALTARGHRQCALLGGSQIHSLFLKANLVHEIWLTIEPLLFGRGVPLLAEQTDTRLRLIANEALSSDTRLLKYEVLA